MVRAHSASQIYAQLLKPLGCSYAEDRAAVLLADGTTTCWDPDGPQPTMALVGMLAFGWYALTAHIIGDDSPLSHGDAAAYTLDVRYSETYLLWCKMGVLVQVATRLHRGSRSRRDGLHT